MIDESCVIYTHGKGFCWCPSSAWNLKDQELCQLCQVKNATIVEKIKFYEVAKPKPVAVKIKSARVVALAYE